MILLDFKCDTCGKVFEVLVASGTKTQPCPKAPVCTGIGDRMLGGQAIGTARTAAKRVRVPGAGSMDVRHVAHGCLSGDVCVDIFVGHPSPKEKA